jgi:hypothetical protein
MNLCDSVKNRPDIEALKTMITKYGMRASNASSNAKDLKDTLNKCHGNGQWPWLAEKGKDIKNDRQPSATDMPDETYVMQP